LYLIRVKGEGKEVGLGRRKASVVKTTALGFFCFCFYLGVEPRSSLCVCVWTVLTGWFSMGSWAATLLCCDLFPTPEFAPPEFFNSLQTCCCCWPVFLHTSEIRWRKGQDAARWRAAIESPARQPREMASLWFRWTFLQHGMLIEHHPTVSLGKMAAANEPPTAEGQTTISNPHKVSHTGCLHASQLAIIVITFFPSSTRLEPQSWKNRKSCKHISPSLSKPVGMSFACFFLLSLSSKPNLWKMAFQKVLFLLR
jgi:hypothetical protein